jgi:hypothetical protein
MSKKHSTYPGTMPTQDEYNAIHQREMDLARLARAHGYTNQAGLLDGSRYAIGDEDNDRIARKIAEMWAMIRGGGR